MMYRKHKLAFKNHVLRMLLLAALTAIPILILIGIHFVRASSTLCREYGDENSFCHKIQSWANVGGKDFLTYFAVLLLLELVPICAFLSLNNPHDCFKCLGKDPDRKFSLYQLSDHEA